MPSLFSSASASIGVGFGTAALDNNSYQVTLMALEAGFRKFDTAEAEGWYDQKSVGAALKDYFTSDNSVNGDCVEKPGGEPTCGDINPQSTTKRCETEDLRISTKIAPWSMTSVEEIRGHARDSRKELVGFCEDTELYTGNDNGDPIGSYPFPLDVYYIHAPVCWKGWHPRCDNPPSILNLYDAWLAMEAVVGIDRSAKRIGLSNVTPRQLKNVIKWTKERQKKGQTMPPPRLPDVLQTFADPFQPANELRQICAEHGIEFVSYSTLGTQHVRSNRNPVLTSPIIQGLASKHGRSVAEVVLSWALQKNMSVIPRSGNKKHIEELARLLTEEPTFLDDDDLRSVDDMKQTAS